MDPIQAVNNLDSAVALLQLNRSQHLILAQSVKVLRDYIERQQTPPAAKGKKGNG